MSIALRVCQQLVAGSQELWLISYRAELQNKNKLIIKSERYRVVTVTTPAAEVEGTRITG